MNAMTKATADVLAERSRQVEKEGYEPAHDDEHADGSLAMAAACYADKERPQSMCPGRWPWSADSWKPKDRRTDLVRAAALLLAEIERMDRRARPGLTARKMRQTSEDNYMGDGDYRMQREYGLTPSGDHIGGRWVLRGPESEWIDCDQLKQNLLERNGFVTA